MEFQWTWFWARLSVLMDISFFVADGEFALRPMCNVCCKWPGIHSQEFRFIIAGPERIVRVSGLQKRLCVHLHCLHGEQPERMPCHLRVHWTKLNSGGVNGSIAWMGWVHLQRFTSVCLSGRLNQSIDRLRIMQRLQIIHYRDGIVMWATDRPTATTTGFSST